MPLHEYMDSLEANEEVHTLHARKRSGVDKGEYNSLTHNAEDMIVTKRRLRIPNGSETEKGDRASRSQIPAWLDKTRREASKRDS